MSSENGATTGAGLRVRLTGLLMIRQLGLLFVVATFLLAQFFLFNLYNQVTFGDFWEPRIAIRDVVVPAILVAIYGGVFLVGLAFAVGPSERSFTVFLLIMVLGFAIANYDHSVLEWLIAPAAGVSIETFNTVSPPKILLAGIMFSAIAVMHYNILSDDFTRRLLGRGVAAEEVLPVRGHMIRFLLPVLGTAVAVATGLALVGEFSQLVFQRHGLFPKFEIVLLGIFGVSIGVLLLMILRELQKRGRSRTND